MTANPDADIVPRIEPRGRFHEAARRHDDRLLLIVVLGLFVAARLVVLNGFRIFTAPDTGSYAPRPDDVFDAVSFAGHAPRPWGVPFLYSLASTDQARAVLQWSIGTIAWALFATALWIGLRSLPARIVAVLAVVGLNLSSSVYPWDFAILSEALSINLGVAALALLLIWAKTGSRIALSSLAIITVWWTFTRQDVIPLVLVLVVVLVGYAWRQRDRRWAAGLTAAVIVAGLGWSFATIPANDQAFRSWGMGVGHSEGTFLYRLRHQVLSDAEVKRVYVEQFGMPPCPGAETIALGQAWRMGDFVEEYRACPDLVAWTAREKGTAGLRYIIADPPHFATTVVRTLPQLLGGTVGAYAAKRSPHVHDAIFFPSKNAVLPIGLTLFVLALAANVLTGAFRSRTWLAVAGTTITVVSVLSAVAGMIFAAGEYSRFGIQEAVLLRVGLIIMIVAAIDAFSTRSHLKHRDLTAPTVSRPLT